MLRRLRICNLPESLVLEGHEVLRRGAERVNAKRMELAFREEGSSIVAKWRSALVAFDAEKPSLFTKRNDIVTRSSGRAVPDGSASPSLVSIFWQ
jgi:hypothetical protein